MIGTALNCREPRAGVSSIMEFGLWIAQDFCGEMADRITIICFP